MPDTFTPGQIAYEAYCAAARPVVADALMRWDETSERYRAIWEAAAQAVLDHADFPPLDLRLDEEEKRDDLIA